MTPSRPRALLVRARRQLCALPLDRVLETMRPLPTVPLAGAPLAQDEAAS